MTVWFTSDTHFSHRNILSLCNRPFDSVEEMDEAIIDNFNSVIQPDDMLVHLGDVALGAIAESLPKVKRINGIKVLVPGNHDRIFSGEKEKMRTRFQPMYEDIFDMIAPEVVRNFPVFNEFGYFTDVDLSHFPYQGDSQENDRHVDKRPTDEGRPLIHGHIHEKRRIEGRMFNVGVDVNGFMPVSEEEIFEWVKTIALQKEWERVLREG